MIVILPRVGAARMVAGGGLGALQRLGAMWPRICALRMRESASTCRGDRTAHVLQNRNKWVCGKVSEHFHVTGTSLHIVSRVGSGPIHVQKPASSHVEIVGTSVPPPTVTPPISATSSAAGEPDVEDVPGLWAMASAVRLPGRTCVTSRPTMALAIYNCRA